jgi:SagB-type dehydrogenase family enzyme
VSRTRTVPWAGWVYGTPEAGDPAELFHETSRLSPFAIDHRARGLALLARSPELATSTTRAVLRSLARPSLPLPAAPLPEVSLAQAVSRRRSARAFGPGHVALGELAALLEAAYGVTSRGPDGASFRAVPSGGALYPLELYVLARRIDDVEPGLHHVDPLRRALEAMPSAEPDAPLSPYDELLDAAALLVAVTGVFWRSRFKYGLRGYRFTLLEAGHVGQNLLLAAAALELAALPVGGFYDRRVERLLGVDGVNESALYLFAVGRPA